MNNVDVTLYSINDIIGWKRITVLGLGSHINIEGLGFKVVTDVVGDVILSITKLIKQ